MNTVRTLIHDRRIEVPAPEELPDDTEVILTIGTEFPYEHDPVSPEEIGRVLTAMGHLQPIEIPDDVAGDLDSWERRLHQHGIDHDEDGLEGTLQ